MILKERLFVLIQSLSKSEKRYFRLFCTRDVSTTNYIRLFDAIEKQSIYNEVAIKEQFKGDKFVTQLHVTKSYLHKLILKSLRNFHANISKDAELKDILRNAEILYNKELFELCKSQLRAAERLARKYELFTGLLEVENWKRKLEQTQHPGSYEFLKQLLEEQEKTLKKLYTINDYWQLAVAVSANMFHGKSSRIKNKSLLTSPRKAVSLESTVLFYNISYLTHWQNNDSKSAENELRTLIRLLDSLPERTREEPGLYVSSVNNLVSYLVFNKKYRDAIVLIQKAKNLYESWRLTSENRTLLKQIMRTYNIELEIYRDTKTLHEHEGFIESTENFVRTNIYKIPKEYVLSFHFQLANIHFIRGDLSKSLHWINQLLNSRFKQLRTDLCVQAHLLNLMVHLEQKNLMVLGYYVNSARRYLKKVKQVLPHEKILLRFFIRIGRLPLLEYKAAFMELRTQLFPEDVEPLVPTDALGYIDYGAWIDRQLRHS